MRRPAFPTRRNASHRIGASDGNQAPPPSRRPDHARGLADTFAKAVHAPGLTTGQTCRLARIAAGLPIESLRDTRTRIEVPVAMLGNGEHDTTRPKD